MTEKPYPRKCPSCRAVAVNPAVVDYEAEIEYDGLPYRVAVPGLPVTVCAACGNRNRDAAADERVIAALRQAAGILQPSEIAAGRAKCGLTPQEVGEAVSVPAEAVEYWEHGGQLQQRAQDRLLRLLFADPAAFRRNLAWPNLSRERLAAPRAGEEFKRRIDAG